MYADDRTDKSVTPQRLLILNYEDYVKIDPILRNPPREAKVVASNLRFTCWNYYDYLQFANRLTKAQSDEERVSIFSKTTNGNIVTMYDIANLYTKELGIKTVPWNNSPFDTVVNKILTQYYQLDNISFDKWVQKATVWTDSINPSVYGIGQTVFRGFQLDFTTEGNTLTFSPQIG